MPKFPLSNSVIMNIFIPILQLCKVSSCMPEIIRHILSKYLRSVSFGVIGKYSQFHSIPYCLISLNENALFYSALALGAHVLFYFARTASAHSYHVLESATDKIRACWRKRIVKNLSFRKPSQGSTLYRTLLRITEYRGDQLYWRPTRNKSAFYHLPL